MRPNTMNKYGVVLDDFGLEKMLDKLMEGFIRPLSREVGGATLDSHHGFVVEYGKDRDVELVHFLKQEIFDYSHVPGRVVLHWGRHRQGARATTSGNRVNLLLWCRSSVFREMKQYQKDFSSWCGECSREKKERQRSTTAATKLRQLRPIVVTIFHGVFRTSFHCMDGECEFPSPSLDSSNLVDSVIVSLV
ncbi:unnamed protein product [Sphenostylis stenocarpa]|uniref:Uncharacterized protein n=1 Tax=Sphenostylis stenocarpa TaxID=92480 RepID=A0AA86T374_9FABA|nr:unnamed protein product [Sphenostylis stenocarpa]